MALTKDQKKAQVQEITDKLKNAQSVMFSQYIGLNVGEVSNLRKQLRETGSEMKVAKKTLMKIAFKKAGYPDIDQIDTEGAIACIFSFEDPLSGAQAAFKFSKTHDKVTLVGGVFDGKLLTRDQAMELAQMPGREQLLTKFACMLRSPLISFATICNSPLSGFARALDQIAEKGGAGGNTGESKESGEAKEADVTIDEPKPEEASAKSEETEKEGSPDSPDSPDSPVS